MLSLLVTTTLLTSPAALPTRYLPRDDGRIAYDDTENPGLPVICVPGMGDLRSQYRFLRPQLVAAGFRVITLDLRGHGDSSARFADVSAGAMGRDVVALAEHLALPEVALVGNSVGGAVVAYAAAELPRVRAVSLIGPFMGFEQGNPVLDVAVQLALQEPWGAWAWSRFFPTMYPTRTPPDHDEHLARVRANLAEPGRVTSLRRMMAARRDDCVARMGRVTAPVQVVMGTDDPDFADPAAQANEVARRMSGTVHLVAGGGHHPHVDSPDDAGAAIVAFLRQSTAPTS